MGLEKVKHRASVAGGVGTIQFVAGAALLIVFLALMFLFGRPQSVLGAVGRCALLLLGVIGLWLLLRGHNTRRLLKTVAQMEELFKAATRISLVMAADALHCSLSQLVSDVHQMQNRSLVRGVYVDLTRRDLVSTGRGVESVPPGKVPDDGMTLREETRKSATPLYAVGLTWIGWACVFPLYRLVDFLLVAVLSVLVYYFVRMRARERLVVVERRKAAAPAVKTGNEALDDMLQSAQGHMEDLRRLDYEINNEGMDGKVRDVLRTTEQILDHVRGNPDSAGQIRQFLNYTLPTTTSLLQNYQDLSRQMVQGENIVGSMRRIEGMMDTIVAAFHRQMDALFRDKALNIEVELNVMKEMIGQSGPGANPTDFSGKQ